MTTKQTTSCVQTEQDPPSFLLKTQLNLRCVHISQVLIDFEDHIQVHSILLILAYRKFFFSVQSEMCPEMHAIANIAGRLQKSQTDIAEIAIISHRYTAEIAELFK